MMNIKHPAKHILLLALLVGLAGPAWSEESETTWEKVVFHLDETVNARWGLMLARSYLDDSPKAKIVFVSYGPGIDFLLEDAEDRRGNPYDPAVTSLIARGVEFRVCGTTLSARKIDQGRLLEGVSVVPSGIYEIARLQLKDGFAYLKP